MPLIIGRAGIAGSLVVAAATFNMVLCFLNTHVLAISVAYVVACEFIIIGLTAALSYRVVTPQALTLAMLFSAYFCMIWLITGTVNPKILRDLLIPIVFLLCGLACAKPNDADRLVYAMVLIVFAVTIVEWFWLDRFLKVFNIVDYYIAKGKISYSEVWLEDINLAVNAMRPEGEGRTLFPVLGLHRASSIFLEPVSAGKFAAVAFAWLLVRFRVAPLKNLVFMALVANVFILADNRFAAVTCLILLIARMMPLMPVTLLWLLPFVSAAGVIILAAMFPLQEIDQSFLGRLVGSGRLIASFDGDDWFGIGQSLPEWVLDNADSGYAYVIYTVGLPGLILLWAFFSFARDHTVDGARYRMLLAFYISLDCLVSQPFSIKTAALAWFLLGASQNRDTVVRTARLVAGPPVTTPELYSAGSRP